MVTDRPLKLRRRLRSGTNIVSNVFRGASPAKLCGRMPCAMSEIAQLLLAWNQGDGQALNRLMPLVHGELHRLAHRYMAGERPGHPPRLRRSSTKRICDLSIRAGFGGRTAPLLRRVGAADAAHPG